MTLPSEKREASHWRGWRPLIAFGIVYTVVICVVVAIRADVSPERGTTDFRDFWLTGLQFRQTGVITTEHGVHNYLPFFVIFMAPWSHLPLKVAIVVFTLLSLGLFGAAVAVTESLLQGRLPPHPRPATYLALILILPYVHSCAVLGQVGLLVLFLIVAAWLLVERGREWQAGVPLALAILIKLLPGVLLVFFVLKLRWRVVVSALVVVVLLGGGLPLLGLGYERTVAQHVGFWNRAAVGQSSEATIRTEKPRKAKYTNTSLAIVIRRLLSPVNADPGAERPPLYVNFANQPRDRIWQIYVGLMALFVTASVVAGTRHTRRWPPAQREPAAAVRAQYGFWCCLMLLAAPLLWTHYFVLAYWPVAVLTHTAVEARTGRALAGVTVWAVGLCLLAWPNARAAGAQLGCVTMCWVVLLSLSARPQSRSLP